MKIIVVCEFSGTVRNAFRALGHEAWSADLLPAEDKHPCHFTGDCFTQVEEWNYFDLAICHPPCTYLCSSGVRWLHEVDSKISKWWEQPAEIRYKNQQEALAFVLRLATLPIPRIAIENPIGVLSTKWRKPDQIIQPWMFGHGETKATCLWLKGLPLLKATDKVSGREQNIFRMSPRPERWKERSRTYTGVAKAMAEQWGSL